MSKLLRYVVVFFVLGMAYSYHLHGEANNALQAEEKRAIQRRATAYSYMDEKRKNLPEYSSAELRSNATRTFLVVAGSSAMFVMIGWAVNSSPTR